MEIEKKSLGEYLASIVFKPAFIGTSAICLEALVAGITGNKFGVEQITSGLQNIAPVMATSFVFEVAAPYKYVGKPGAAAHDLWVTPIIFAGGALVGSALGGIFDSKILHNIGGYVTYGLKAGLIGGVLSTFLRTITRYK